MILLGNVISLVGCVLMVSVGFIRKKEHMLITQCAQFAFMGVGHLLLGAVSGMLSCVVSIIRNVVFAKREGTVLLKLLFIAVQVAMTLCFGADSWIHWLPVIACAIFVWFLDVKDAALFKVVIIVTQIFWCIYDFSYQNYVAFTFDVLTIVSNIIGIHMLKKA